MERTSKFVKADVFSMVVTSMQCVVYAWHDNDFTSSSSFFGGWLFVCHLLQRFAIYNMNTHSLPAFHCLTTQHLLV